MPAKRKAPASVGYSDSTGGAANKRSKDSQPTAAANGKKAKKAAKAEASDDAEPAFDHSRPEEKFRIVQREFYPTEMSNERCKMYNANEIPRPIEELHAALEETSGARIKIKPGDAVVHWFKRDLRTRDNRALSMASALAVEKKVPLVCVYLISPQDFQAHFTSAPRVDFELRTLAVLREDLAALDVPLHIETVEKRKNVPARMVELAEEWGAKHVFCNVEYEVDELRREAKLVRRYADKGIDFQAVDDDVIVPPGDLMSGTGKQYAVYSPWFRAWVAHIHKNTHLLDEYESPKKNPTSARQKFKKVFDVSIPEAPPNKRLSKEEKKRMESLWPAGEHEAWDRLETFLNEKIGRYQTTRNFPAQNSTSKLSVHFSSGTLAARSAVRMARDSNRTKKLDGGNEGIQGWISEVAWRDFYKHVLANWPYVW